MEETTQRRGNSEQKKKKSGNQSIKNLGKKKKRGKMAEIKTDRIGAVQLSGKNDCLDGWRELQGVLEREGGMAG